MEGAIILVILYCIISAIIFLVFVVVGMMVPNLIKHIIKKLNTAETKAKKKRIVLQKMNSLIAIAKKK